MCLKHPEHAPTNIDDLTRSTGPAGGALPPAHLHGPSPAGHGAD